MNEAYIGKSETGRIRLVLLVLIIGLFVGIVTIAFIYLLVFGYYVFTPSGKENEGAAVNLAIGWIPATFFAILVFAATSLVCYRMRSRHLFLGFLIGALSVIAMQGLVALQYPPVVPSEFLWYGFLGVSAGLLGGWWSREEARRSIAGERVLFRAMREMAHATTAEAVAKTLGETISSLNPIGVGIWRTFPGTSKNAANATGTWSAERSNVFAPIRLIETAEPVNEKWDSPRTVLRETLPQKTREEWVKQGIRSAFVSPMLFRGEKPFGLLFVGFRERLRITGRSRQRLLSAATGAAMALEKLASWDERRDQDRKLGVLEERERLSREIHDSLIQYLSSIVRELDGAEMAGEASVHEAVFGHVGRAREGAQIAAGDARRLIQALRPELLEGSLSEALSTLVQRLSGESSVEAVFEVFGKIHQLPSETEHALSRIAQEALNNVRHHSNATRTGISLSYEPDGVVLEIVDNGSGFRYKSKHNKETGGGFGMQSMRERAERIGGELRVQSFENAGTKVTVEAPTYIGNLNSRHA